MANLYSSARAFEECMNLGQEQTEESVNYQAHASMTWVEGDGLGSAANNVDDVGCRVL